MCRPGNLSTRRHIFAYFLPVVQLVYTGYIVGKFEVMVFVSNLVMNLFVSQLFLVAIPVKLRNIPQTATLPGGQDKTPLNDKTLPSSF